jgi:hypothetical protein
MHLNGFIFSETHFHIRALESFQLIDAQHNAQHGVGIEKEQSEGEKLHPGEKECVSV